MLAKDKRSNLLSHKVGENEKVLLQRQQPNNDLNKFSILDAL